MMWNWATREVAVCWYSIVTQNADVCAVHRSYTLEFNSPPTRIIYKRLFISHMHLWEILAFLCCIPLHSWKSVCLCV